MQVSSPAEGTGSWEAIFKMAAYTPQRKQLILATEVKALISARKNCLQTKSISISQMFFFLLVRC